ncbi:hypothetical protein [Bacillus amyloliquefaciens]|uniref:hypothetical protein n=1 Tax=Bacillus amyloliquefaciens TaxID=1390 RepID=UPI003D80B451
MQAANDDDGEPAAKLLVRTAAQSVRVPAARLDLLMDRVGELVSAQSRLSQLAQQDGGVASGAPDARPATNIANVPIIILLPVPVESARSGGGECNDVGDCAKPVRPYCRPPPPRDDQRRRCTMPTPCRAHFARVIRADRRCRPSADAGGRAR